SVVLGGAVAFVIEVLRAESWPAEPVRTEAAPEPARTEASAPEAARTEVATSASAGERRLLVPAERAGEPLERGHGGGEVFGGDRIGDLGADAFDDDAETILRRAAFVGQGPRAVGIRDPAEFDQSRELVRRQRS